MTPRLRFAIPPSLGQTLAAASASSLQALLQELIGDLAEPEVYVSDSYPALSLDLLEGRCDLAWGPPSVCARAEVHGARVLVQALRAGAARYRSAIVARWPMTIDPKTAASLAAAWVDADSTGGYLLAYAWLRAQGIDPRHGLKRQRFYGSYRAAVDAVLQGDADFTSVFATSADADAQRTALNDLSVAAERLVVIAYTPETPNDGLAARPGLDPAIADRIVERFIDAGSRPGLRDRLDEIFRADGFVRAGDDEYRALHEIVMSSLN